MRKDTVYHRRSRQRANLALLQVLVGPGEGLRVLLQELGCHVGPELDAYTNGVVATKARRAEKKKSKEGKAKIAARRRRRNERAAEQRKISAGAKSGCHLHRGPRPRHHPPLFRTHRKHGAHSVHDDNINNEESSHSSADPGRMGRW